MSLNDFGLTKDGMVFPDFQDYLNEFLIQGKIEFGDNFQIDSETAFGQLIEAFAYLFEGNSNILQNIYNSIFIHSMSGQMLDRYAANFNIERLQGRKAYGTIVIEGTPGHIVARGFEFKSKSGLFYTLSSNTLLNSDGVGTSQVVANEIGSIYNTEKNTITEKAKGDENVTSATNPAAITNGSDIESDIDFRERIIKLFSGGESASVNGIKRSMLELSQVIDCKVLENNTNIKDETTGLEPGQITVIIRGLIDDEVAEKLFNTRSAGIQTVGNRSITVISDSNQLIEEHLYQAIEKDLFIKVENVQLYSGTSLDTKAVIVSELMANIANTLQLGVKANYEKILGVVYNIPEIEEADISISIDNITYVKTDIIISAYEYLNLKAENIEVVI